MATANKNPRICSKGHKYYKTSDCPTCPVCENERKPSTGFLSVLSAPARRALEREGIQTLEQLSKKSETEILQFHGMGPATLPKLRSALSTVGLSFKK
ncbi:MAG: RNA polymerase alpha subunit C-terminal domain-containing protein [Chitinophagaceae bacterium]